MGRKIICEACESTFKEEMLNNTSICPVCGTSLDGEDFDEKEDNNANNDFIFFHEVNNTYIDRPESNGVRIHCVDCNLMSNIKFNDVEKIVDQEYIIVKEGVVVKCRGCGKIHENRKIKFRKRAYSAPPLPQCPVCKSYMLNKIKLTSKIGAAALLGSFAIPYTSMTYECKNCGHKF